MGEFMYAWVAAMGKRQHISAAHIILQATFHSELQIAMRSRSKTGSPTVMALLSMPMYPIDDCVGGFIAKALPLIHDGGIAVRALKPTSLSSRVKLEASSSGITLQDKACLFCLLFHYHRG